MRYLRLREDQMKRKVQHLGEVVRSYATRHRLFRTGRLSEVTRAWEKVMPPRVVSHTCCVRANRGVLLVEVASSALLGELQFFSKTELVAKLNELLEGPGIHDVRFRLGSGGAKEEPE